MSGRKTKLLIVDDNPDTLDLLAEQLESWYDIVLAGDGEEALRSLAQFGSSVGAVLLDLNMPRLDGFGLLERLQRSYPTLPVIIHTGDASLDHVLAAQRFRVDGFLVKPCSQKEIIKKIEEAVGAKGRAINALENRVVEIKVQIEQYKKDLTALDQDYRANRAALQEMLAQSEQELRELRERIRREVLRLEALAR